MNNTVVYGESGSFVKLPGTQPLYPGQPLPLRLLPEKNDPFPATSASGINGRNSMDQFR
jgi:hypothetical protein